MCLCVRCLIFYSITTLQVSSSLPLIYVTLAGLVPFTKGPIGTHREGVGKSQTRESPIA